MKREKGFANLLLLFALAAAAAGFAFTRYVNNSQSSKSLPLYAGGYSAAPLSCHCQANRNTDIKLIFAASEQAQNEVPEYTIKENIELGKTEVIFKNVKQITKQFDYNEIVGNPLIDSIDYNIKGNDLVIDINRRSTYIPAAIETNGAIATITLKQGDENYPQVSDQRPADNSAAFPALRTISFKASLSAGLKSAYVTFNGTPANFNATTVEPDVYFFQLNENVEQDKEYRVKTVVTDENNRTTVTVWMFRGEIPVAGILGPDRFKNLGWWGEINSEGTSVRKGPGTVFEKIGSLSSINRVKVLKEVFGESIGENNLWYEIDGGKYPHSYVFSEYITPMVQPTPPTNFSIPDGVKENEKWIDVDLARKIMTLFDYNKPVFSTYVSPGREENPTQTGTFRVWYKLYKAEMRGGPPLHSYRYDLKDIPWVMYYNYDYAIHGVYWHDNFGTPQSAGCTNMTQGDAKYIFENTLPAIPEGKQLFFSNNTSPGIVVHNHE